MHKNIKWSDREIEGLSFEDLNKITIGKLNQIEANQAKTDFLSSKPELVAELAKPFINPTQMKKYKGKNEKLIRAAGNLIEHHKMPRPEWFTDTNDYKTWFSTVDYKARTEKIDYKSIANKIDYKARTEKIDYKSYQSKRIANTDFKAKAANTDYKAIVAKVNQKEKAKKLMKPISQFDLQGNWIKDWESITQASKELNLEFSAISMCCRGKLKKSQGYIWKFQLKQN